MARPVGKLGCLPGAIPTELKALTYYVAGDLPKAPATVKTPSVSSWGMLGNDRYGDCGVAGIQHGLQADAAIVKSNERFPSESQVVDYYLHYTKGDDSGVVLHDLLAYIRKHKFYDKTISAYAPVSINDVPTLQTAIWLYGFAYAGITVTSGMQKAFEDEKPWDAEACAGKPVGGHCVPIVGYDDHYLYCVTWGGIQTITYPAWHTISTEAWAVISGEFVARHGNGRGVNIDALNADLNKLNR